MSFTRILSLCAVVVTMLFSESFFSQSVATIGTGTSSSSTRGPLQRSDSGSSSVFSRSNMVYTSTELSDGGLSAGVEISQVDWYNKSGSNIIDATGDAILKIYMRNTSNADATVDSAWTDVINGSTLVGTYIFNMANNFPGVDGWQAFVLDSPFLYSGGTLEIAVEWDCSGLTSTNADPNLLFTGNGALKWRWSSTSHVSLAVRAGSSSAPSTFSSSSNFKSERANVQLYYDIPVASCGSPTNLDGSNITDTSADFNWDASGGNTYTWKVVDAGAGSSAAAVETGSTSGTTASASSLMPLTSYDLFVQADCGANGTSSFAGPYSFATKGVTSSLITIGEGSSSSSTRGPFQRSGATSSTVFSRFVHIYTAAELAAAGMSSGDVISHVNWELASSNIIAGSGNANMKIYVRNSAATEALADDWSNHIAGSSLVFNKDFNTSNNFPGANGWMQFDFNSPIVYTGDAFEIAVDWDCSQVSTPAFDGDGAIKWRWESTAPDNLVVKKTSSSGASSNISDVKNERANIQFSFTTPPSPCPMPTDLNISNLTSNSADMNWASSTNAGTYSWKLVLAGAGSSGPAVVSGSTPITNTSSGAVLTELTTYDLFVEANCGANGTSGYAGPYTFTTPDSSPSILTIGVGTSSSSTRGPFQRSDTASSTVFSRFVHIYPASQIQGTGLVNGDLITSVNWELASQNMVIGDGNANMKVYIKNSSATEAAAGDWSDLINGSTLAFEKDFNTTNNFPGVFGWMPFNFSEPFTYTGGSIEIAVDWDCSEVTTPAFSGDGAIKWRWDSTAPDNLVVKKTSSSAASSNISDLRDERANIQIVYSSNCPGIAEICGNGIDDDCDGQVDEDCDGCVAANFVNAPSGLNEVQTGTTTQLRWDHYADDADACILQGGTISSLNVSSPFTQTPGRVLIQGQLINGLPSGFDNSAPLTENASFTLFNPNTFPSGITGSMVPGAFYKWRVQCGCIIDNTIPLPQRLAASNVHISPWSDYDLFTNLGTGNFQLENSQLKSFENGDAIVYPNPVDNVLNIDFSQFDGDVEGITIHNLLGEVVFTDFSSNYGNSVFNTDMGNFESGIYMLTIKTTQGFENFRIIKKD